MATSGGRRPRLKGEKRTTGGAGKAPTRSAGATAAGGGGGGRGGRGRARPRRRAAAPRRARGPLGWLAAGLRGLLRLVFGVVWRTALVVALTVGGAVAWFASQLPPAEALIDARSRGSVTLLDRDATVFAWRGEQFDRIARAADVSPHLVHAVVATEDRRFYRHFGISPRGVAGAIRINLAEGRGPLSGHGGSTLTQQTAKLMCLGVPYDPARWDSEAAYEADCRETTLGRKLREALFAMALEAKYSKDEILTLYLNRAYLGASARGFEAAAQRYFGVSAAEVSPAQAAMLAGLLIAPSRLAPTNDLGRAQARAATVIRLMHEEGYLTDAQRDAAWAAPATLSQAARQDVGGHFADWVMTTGPTYLTRDTTEDVVLRTTFDRDVQRAAEEAMRAVFDARVRAGSQAEAAIVVMSADGAVRGMVGGRDTSASGGFNRAAQARRQTGSSFKPFIYAAAMDLGYSPRDVVVDEPWCIDVPGSEPYCPQNYSREFAGRVTLTEALARSLNIPAVRISEFVGREIVQKVARDFGIDSDLAGGPALALGASESTLIEMTGAYAGFLNGGRAVTPYGMTDLRLRGASEPLMGKEGGFGRRVISQDAARALVYMLHRVVEEGTGARARLPGWEVAGKTGTTQANRDAWFVGFTADYVVGVWMGHDDNAPLTGVTGGGLPAEIFAETMARILDGLPPAPLPMDVPAAATAQAPAPAPAPAQPRPAPPQPGQQAPAQPQGGGLVGALNRLFGG